MASIETLIGNAKRDKNGNWIWNGESYENVLLMLPYLSSMQFKSNADAKVFEKMEQDWKDKNNKKTTETKNKSNLKHSDLSSKQIYIYSGNF